jgi:hypothetical protein
MKKCGILILSGIVTLVGFFCSFDSGLPIDANKNTSSKTVNVGFCIATSDSFNTISRSARVLVTAPNMDSISQPMVMSDSSISVTLRAVPIGYNRLFEVFVYDSAYQLTYYGSQYADLYPNQRTYVYIKLRRASSSEVVVIGTIEDDTIPPPDTITRYITPPVMPWILKGTITAKDTRGFCFGSKGSLCSDGCPIAYVFYFSPLDTLSGRDTTWSVYSSDTLCFTRFPRTGQYAVSAQAVGQSDTLRSPWSPSLYIRVVTLRQIETIVR